MSEQEIINMQGWSETEIEGTYYKGRPLISLSKKELQIVIIELAYQSKRERKLHDELVQFMELTGC